MSQRCLVLNKAWHPITTVALRRAIVMLFSEYKDGTPKARVIEPNTFQPYTWEDWAKLEPVSDETLKSAHLEFRIPEVILLSRYDKLPQPKVHFSRRNLYKRDDMTCQYCGAKPGSAELNIDHVIPKSRGGQSTWENCVLSCVKCNSRKADKLLHECGMKLRKTPKKPRMNMFKLGGMTKPIESWKQFISETYWSVEMK